MSFHAAIELNIFWLQNTSNKFSPSLHSSGNIWCTYYIYLPSYIPIYAEFFVLYIYNIQLCRWAYGNGMSCVPGWWPPPVSVEYLCHLLNGNSTWTRCVGWPTWMQDFRHLLKGNATSPSYKCYIIHLLVLHQLQQVIHDSPLITLAQWPCIDIGQCACSTPHTQWDYARWILVSELDTRGLLHEASPTIQCSNIITALVITTCVVYWPAMSVPE